MKRQMTNNQRTIRDYRCADCGHNLGIWMNVAHEQYVACSANSQHRKFLKKEEVNQMDSAALMTMEPRAMEIRIGMAMFPQQLTPAEVRLLAQVAITYGFDPLMGEVSIYQGRPWVSIDGRYRKAQETGQLDGVETRPANKQERIDWEIPGGDFFFRSEVYVKGASRPFVGWGRVFERETIIRDNKPGDAFKPTVTNPQRMAEKRAEAQALKKAFHIPLPSAEDMDSPESLPEIQVTVSNPPPPVQQAPVTDPAFDALKSATEKPQTPLTQASRQKIVTTSAAALNKAAKEAGVVFGDRVTTGIFEEEAQSIFAKLPKEEKK